MTAPRIIRTNLYFKEQRIASSTKRDYVEPRIVGQLMLVEAQACTFRLPFIQSSKYNKSQKGGTSFIFHQCHGAYVIFVYSIDPGGHQVVTERSWLSEPSRARGPDNNITGSQLPRIRKTSSTREAKNSSPADFKLRGLFASSDRNSWQYTGPFWPY